jgi:light-regulated signal transduction histidine kinase (bacteriophytochrome)
MLADKNAQSFDDKSKRHIDFIIRGSEKANQLLDALVDYSPLNTQAEPYTVIDCNLVVEEIKQQLAVLIERSGAEITTTNLPEVLGDPAQISKVFYHLIHNALHYQVLGNKPLVVIDLEEQAQLWPFCVKDNGIGIPVNLSEKIFKVLSRAVSDKKFSGMGMGLNIAKKILARHGGSLWLAEPQGLGSSFYFTLPKALPHE